MAEGHYTHEQELRPDEPSPIPLTWLTSLCLDFVNSTFADHTGGPRVFDRLPMRKWWQWLGSRWDLRLPAKLDSKDMEKLRQFRGELRGVVERASRGEWPNVHDVAWINRRLARSPYRFAVGVERRSWRVLRQPEATTWDGVIGDILLSFTTLLTNGKPSRIRRCSNRSCTWIFYDDSRNRTRRWCDPRHCGNLIKVRRFRAKVGSAR